MRPRSLVEVAEITLAGNGSFEQSLASFLDDFYGEPRESAFRSEPPLLAAALGWQGQVWDAYLAATAQELARKYEFAIPSWTAHDSRKLRAPWFASSLAALRAVLILESPASFRERNLFVSANALSRV